MTTLQQKNIPSELPSLKGPRFNSKLRPKNIITKTSIAFSTANRPVASPVSPNVGSNAILSPKTNVPLRKGSLKTTGAQTPRINITTTPSNLRSPKTLLNSNATHSVSSPTKKTGIPSTPNNTSPTRNKESMLHKSTPARMMTENSDSPTLDAQQSSPQSEHKNSRVNGNSPRKSPNVPLQQKIDVSNVKSRVGSLSNIKHSPKGSDVKIYSVKPDFSNVKSRVGSLDNVHHTKKGGDIKIFSKKLDFSSVQSRVGSLDNIKHQPKGGDNRIFSSPVKFTEVKSRVGSLDNIKHQPKGGDNQIFSSPVKFTEVKARVGSLDNIKHKPGGGDVVIFDEKLNFREIAAPKVDVGASSRKSSSTSSVFDDERLTSLSPVSSLALDDVVETSSPAELTSPTPYRVALSPIAEILQVPQEEAAVEDQVEILSIAPAEIVPTQTEQHDEKTTVVKGKHAPAVQEQNKEQEESVQQVASSVDVTDERPRPPRVTPQSVKAKIAMLEAKNAMAAAKRAAAREEALNAAIAANKNLVSNSQQEFGVEAETGEQELQDDDDTAESQPDETEPVFEMNDTQLLDAELNFEVNVARKSMLLAEAQKARTMESLYIPEVTSVVEVPPETQVVPVEPELTLAQQDAYNSSWL